MANDFIIVKGAKEHNLKNINIKIPKNKLVVITGLSGSGKSSLAFDTLYSEGQRRYVESLSNYAKQFLGKMNKPDVDMIEGLSPAISIEQKTASHNPRSTVGTVTEIYDYFRLLYARVGKTFCYKCGRTVSSQSPDEILKQILANPPNSKAMILSPIISNQKGSFESLFKDLRKKGFARVWVDEKIYDLDEKITLNKNKKHTIKIIVDRLVINKESKGRIFESVEIALKESEGLVVVELFGDDNQVCESLLFSEKLACAFCNINYLELNPSAFSFNSPQGACPICNGLGYTSDFDEDLIVPDQSLSLREGAVALWKNRNSVSFLEFLNALTKHFEVSINTPFEKLSATFKDALFYGTKNEKIEFFLETEKRKIKYKRKFEGLIPNLARRYKETNSAYIRDEIGKYMRFRPCAHCEGTRLKREVRAVKVNDLSISDLSGLSVEKTLDFFESLKGVLKGKDAKIAKSIIKEITDRLAFLQNVGLGYLTINREAATLSGGEAQRIRLATQIGSKLSGVLYVLDEPSIGLHQKDNRKLIKTLISMRDLGNTVLVVEHDEETILAADYVIDIGPAAGVKGGEVVFAGSPKALLKDKKSLTGRYISKKEKIEFSAKRRQSEKKLVIRGASENNLKDIDVGFPLESFVCVTGVSGSGKSSLVNQILYKALLKHIYSSRQKAGKHKNIEGLEHLDKVINIDQSPIGRTPRSNPGTYTGVFTDIRELFAQTSQARQRGYKPARFSFNIKGGRCEACQGDGIVKIEMHFLPDIYVPCEVCLGKRYNSETLQIAYKGKNIDDVLKMTTNQALSFFSNVPAIKTKLQTLVEVGLGYIKIGQFATTLSGGEAQRIKLAKELSKKNTGKTLYILDEPTTGLHFEDIKKLLLVLNRLVDAKNSVIVIEHNLDVIKCADYIVDLGKEGGEKGGELIASGTPEELSLCKNSYTGKFLKKILSP